MAAAIPSCLLQQDTEVLSGTLENTSEEVITGHQPNMQLTPQDVFQFTLYLTIGHSPFYRFRVFLHCFSLCIRYCIVHKYTHD